MLVVVPDSHAQDCRVILMIFGSMQFTTCGRSRQVGIVAEAFDVVGHHHRKLVGSALRKTRDRTLVRMATAACVVPWPSLASNGFAGCCMQR